VKRPAPVLRLVWHQAARIKRLLRENDDLSHDLAVWKRRANSWRRAAFELAPVAGQQAMSVLLAQADSEDIADLEEIADDERNTTPRSLP
jgi:hypothetical protein